MPAAGDKFSHKNMRIQIVKVHINCCPQIVKPILPRFTPGSLPLANSKPWVTVSGYHAAHFETQNGGGVLVSWGITVFAAGCAG